jgi:hypothetical protein
MEGFTLLKQLPLDGNRGNVKLEVKANFALPEPEIEYSTESHRSLVGMGKASFCLLLSVILLAYQQELALRLTIFIFIPLSLLLFRRH